MKLFDLKQTVYRNPYAFQRGFDKWLERNYATFILIRNQALKVRAKKVLRYGIGTLWEVARHHSYTSAELGPIKLDNTFRTDVALLLMMTEPKLADFFELRKRNMRTGCFGPQFDMVYPMEDQLEAKA